MKDEQYCCEIWPFTGPCCDKKHKARRTLANNPALTIWLQGRGLNEQEQVGFCLGEAEPELYKAYEADVFSWILLTMGRPA